jgi:XapX domain-containing protein
LVDSETGRPHGVPWPFKQEEEEMKIAIGLLVGLAIGTVCRLLHIPSPAPPVLEGALLVVAMTVGYSLVDRYFAHRTATAKAHCSSWR